MMTVREACKQRFGDKPCITLPRILDAGRDASVFPKTPTQDKHVTTETAECKEWCPLLRKPTDLLVVTVTRKVAA